MAPKLKFVVSDYIDILLRVQELASNVRNDYIYKHKAKDGSAIDLSLIELDDYYAERRNNALMTFLYQLDDDQIKVIQTVMYIGRDYEVPTPSEEVLEIYYERKAEGPDFKMPKPPIRVANPDEYLCETIEALGQSKGWKEKNIEINIIYEKMMKLPDYLLRGFKVLGIQ